MSNVFVIKDTKKPQICA